MLDIDIDINNFKEVIDLVNSVNLNPPRVPSYTPPADSRWHNPVTGEVREEMPSGLYCLDVETIKDNKNLVMASVWDLINEEWWCWLSKPGTNQLLSFIGKCVLICHRSTFELGYIRQSYSLDCQIRFLDTFAQACCKYHPAKVNLYRQMPYLPMFRGSNDLSLAELSLKLCGRHIDKEAVEVFKDAKDESWRESKVIIHKDVEKQLLKGWKKLGGIGSFEADLIVNCPTGKIDSLDPTWQTWLTSKSSREAKWIWRQTPTLSELMTYNMTDVSATVGVFANMWSWYKEQPIEYISGLYHRSVPFLPLANNWFDKIGEIESEYSKRVGEMVSLVEQIEQEYLEVVGKNDWDYFDWGKWSNTKKDKSLVGQYKWFGSTGLSSKKLMRLARLSWNGRPMLVIEQPKRDEEGNVIGKKDGEASKTQVWHTVSKKGSWLESVIACEDLQPLDNPTNTSGEFKDIVTVFSKTFLPFWESGVLTSESSAAKSIAKLYASISFWNSFRDRIINKAPIYNTGEYYAMCLRSQVNATVTNRAVCNIGLVMSKVDEKKVGTEIGGHICTPKGYKFVFADFDSIQAVITALYAAVGTAKELGIAKKPIDALNNEYSRAVLLGTKIDKTTLAYLIAAQAGISYDHGKNCQYAMLFGAGMMKLALMLGSEKLAKEVISYFKGTLNKSTGKWEGGIASCYFNFSQELAKGLTMYNGTFYYQDELETTFLHRPLSNILRPSHRGKDFGGTAQNAVTQAVDVDCLCYISDAIINQCNDEGIYIRYATSVHDALYLIAKDEDCERVAEIFQECHERMYRKLLATLNIDVSTFPHHLLRYSGVDINSRYTKHAGEKGVTYSNQEGYDYSITASFIQDDDESVMIEEDYVSSKALVKFYRQQLQQQSESPTPSGWGCRGGD